MSHQKSAFSKMVYFAIVACLDPVIRKPKVAAISRNLGQCLPKLKKNPEFREIAATVFLLCAVSRHATIAK